MKILFEMESIRENFQKNFGKKKNYILRYLLQFQYKIRKNVWQVVITEHSRFTL